MIQSRRGATTIVPEGLVRLVIAIVLLVVVIAIAAKIFSVSDTTSRDRFFELIELIEKMGTEQPCAFEDLTMVMDEKSAIVGFAKGAQEVEYVERLFPIGEVVERRSTFARPLTCGIDKSCLCLCQGTFATPEGGDATKPLPLHCDGKLLCEGLSVDFPPEISWQEFKAGDHHHYYWFRGGFHFKRMGPLALKDEIQRTPYLAARRSLIFVEKGNADLVGLCFGGPPCLECNAGALP